MSEIKVNSIKGVGASTAAITVNNTDGTCTANITNNLSNRNKVINGGMTCCQRATTFAVTGSTNAYVVPDRFKCVNIHDGAYTLTQSTTSPDGFGSSIKVDVTTADTTLTTSQRMYFVHFIEAQDLQDLAYGTSSAKSVVVSFYVRSNKTGNYAFALNQADNGFKNISFQYAINSANTWERKSFVIPGDTAGVINNDNGAGIEMYFWLAAGPTYTSGSTQSSWTAYSNGDFAAGQGVNLLDSTSNEWYLTGVQFEINSSGVPTDFEHRSFGQELALCQRYYYEDLNIDHRLADGQIACNTTGAYALPVGCVHPVTMRANPTLTLSNFTYHGSSFNSSNANTMAWGMRVTTDNTSQFRITAGEAKFDAEL